MRKIISLFQRNYDGDRLVRDEVVPGAEWVIAGEGTATRKWDGTACMVKDGKLWKRYDAKRGRGLGPQMAKFEPAQDPDPVTGHWPGWIPVSEDAPEDRWHREALARHIEIFSEPPADGTYELCGPRINGNPEGEEHHTLIPHGFGVFPDAPRDYVGLRSFLSTQGIEGLVWHHPDGRMVKIKARDFGLPWNQTSAASNKDKAGTRRSFHLPPPPKGQRGV